MSWREGSIPPEFCCSYSTGRNWRIERGIEISFSWISWLIDRNWAFLLWKEDMGSFELNCVFRLSQLYNIVYCVHVILWTMQCYTCKNLLENIPLKANRRYVFLRIFPLCQLCVKCSYSMIQVLLKIIFSW